ncbi:two component transcriptional regulator, AraC family [Paenibacillus algicola]|uniref:Two component transcriptional regulator, AraC family n=1 Tax=Paenibacillus algicola TaxID=2565926 RepID=A0A4P8XFM1_9BACL|nr:response regulator [Paenibacillus algicola]QCT01085.1 two component transcriptional regulator, AraC family [Paenibacillus algicola]
MNILVVDDESFVREALTETIREASSEYVIAGAARHGEEALEILQSHPVDLVITDVRMPRMDGLELCRRIYEYNPEISIVLLTGYADFSYARQAMKYQVSDYLLKPCDSAEIIQVIEKLAEAHRLQRFQKQVEQLRHSHVLEKHLNDLLYGIPIPYFNQSILPVYQCIYLLCIAPAEKVPHLIWNEQQALNAVKNIAEEWLEPQVRAVGILEEDHLVIYMFNEHVRTLPEMEALALELHSAIQSNLKLTVKLGLSQGAQHQSEVPRRYRQSCQAMQAALQEPSKHLCSYGNEDSEQELDEWVPDMSEKGKRRVVEHMLQVIDERYPDNLSLRLLADEVYMNPTYLGRIFKEDTGHSFNYYLNLVRVKQAKQLLEDFRIRVYEVCDQVGFKDPAYFSQTFKKYTGVTPQEYQNSRQADV